jgi:hypothetical protein
MTRISQLGGLLPHALITLGLFLTNRGRAAKWFDSPMLLARRVIVEEKFIMRPEPSQVRSNAAKRDVV